jgi:hypothetical protein
LAVGIRAALFEVAVTDVISVGEVVPSPMLKLKLNGVSSAVDLSAMSSTVGCDSYAPMSTVRVVSRSAESAGRGKPLPR